MIKSRDGEARRIKPCILCSWREKCRKERVEKGSKKCLMLLKKGERERS
jgi:hypothetical protein